MSTTHVVYEGVSNRAKAGLPVAGALEFHINDEDDGELHKLYEGVPTPVPASLSKELLGGDSERCKGHKFREATKEERDALKDAGLDEDEVPAPPTPPTAPEGGPGGSGPAAGGGTTAAASR